MVLHAAVELAALFGAQMANGALHQVQSCGIGSRADLLHLVVIAQAVHVGVGSECQVDVIGLVN